MANTKVKAEQLEAAQTNITSLGTLTSLTVDNIGIDGSTITCGASQMPGDLILDAVGDIILDADGGDIILKDGGTTFGQFSISSGDFFIQQPTADKDIVFRGLDGSSYISALTLDMSEAGAATFNGEVLIPEKLTHAGDTDTHFKFAGANDIRIVAGNVEHAAFDGTIVFNQSGADMDFRVESNSNANMLFVDAGNDRVGIGTNAPTAPLTVLSNSGANAIRMFGRSADNYSELYASSNDGGTNYFFIQGHSNQTKLWTLNNTPLQLGTNSGVKVNIAAGSSGYVGLIGSSDVRLTLSNNGTEGDNSANWVRGNSGGLSFNASSTEFKWEIGGTEKMCLDNNAFLSIGNDDASTLNASSGYADICAGKGAGDNAGITLYSGTNHAGGIAFADGTSGNATYRGLIQYSHGSDEFTFWTAATNRGAINSVGQFTMGSASHADDVLYLARNSTTGKILRFYSGGSEVGYISTNTYSLPSDRNFKKDIEDFTLGLDFVKDLKPKQYRQKIEDSDVPLQTGLIAQDVEESLTAAGVSKNKYMMLQHTPDEDETQSQYGIDYAKLIPVLINAIQELSAKLEAK